MKKLKNKKKARQKFEKAKKKLIVGEEIREKKIGANVCT